MIITRLLAFRSPHGTTGVDAHLRSIERGIQVWPGYGYGLELESLITGRKCGIVVGGAGDTAEMKERESAPCLDTSD